MGDLLGYLGGRLFAWMVGRGVMNREAKMLTAYPQAYTQAIWFKSRGVTMFIPTYPQDLLLLSFLRCCSKTYPYN